jgi:hypothetical protein
MSGHKFPELKHDNSAYDGTLSLQGSIALNSQLNPPKKQLFPLTCAMKTSKYLYENEIAYFV